MITQKQLRWRLRQKDAQINLYNFQFSETRDILAKIVKCEGDHEQLLSNMLIPADTIFIFMKMYPKIEILMAEVKALKQGKSRSQSRKKLLAIRPWEAKHPS